MERELNLTEYERQVRQAHGLGSDRQSLAHGSQIPGSQDGMKSPLKQFGTSKSFARDISEDQKEMNL